MAFKRLMTHILMKSYQNSWLKQIHLANFINQSYEKILSGYITNTIVIFIKFKQ